MSRCKCKTPVEVLRKRLHHARGACLSCGLHIPFRAMPFDFDQIDWDVERFPQGAPYAGKTFKEVARTDLAFVKWYAENTNSRPQRDFAERPIRELAQ